MEASVITARRAVLDRRAFVLLCVVGGAALGVVAGGTWISLALYGVSLLIVIAVSLVLRDLAGHPEHRRWLVPLSIAALVGILVLSRFGRLQILLFGTPITRFGEWVGISYLIFRLIHVLIDSNKLTKLAVNDTVKYGEPHPEREQSDLGTRRARSGNVLNYFPDRGLSAATVVERSDVAADNAQLGTGTERSANVSHLFPVGGLSEPNEVTRLGSDNSRYRNKSVSPGDLCAYALFPPALIAGPIHRATQFLPQLDKPHYPASEPKLIDCLWRIGVGAAKKLVLANALSLIALNTSIAANPLLPRWLLWLSLVAYTLMIYFDFAGYSDIAIGAAGLVGIVLPENFANPYAQGSVTRFWQTWHMSLSFWLRDYIFFPLSRFLLARLGRRWATPIMATAHLVTMGIAGLWHGFTTGFLAWGLWHGAGLFANAQWSSFAKRRGLHMPTVVGSWGLC